MTKSYNGLNVLKPIEDLYLSLDTMKTVLNECTSNDIAVVDIEFYVLDGEEYIPQNNKDSFEYINHDEGYNSWNDYVEVCNKTALGVLDKNSSNMFCSYVLLKNIK